LSLCSVLLSLPACELVATFDQSKLDENRTLGPTPLPTLDGAVAVVPDGSLRFDGALVRDDTGVPSPGDAATDASAADASSGQPDAEVADASTLDAAVVEDAAVDAGASDAGDAGDASSLDAAPSDAGPPDAGDPPDLFPDV
jgi:hypothetical protein